MAIQRDRFRSFNDEDGAMSLDDLLMQIQQPQIDTEAIARQQEAQRQAQIAAEQRAYEEQVYRQAQARQEELRAQNAARLAAEQEAARQAQIAAEEQRRIAAENAWYEQQARAQAEAQRQAELQAYEDQQRVFRDTQSRQEELRNRLFAEQEAARVQAEAQSQAPITVQEVINQISAQPAPEAPDKASIINNLVGQIKARSNTSQWSGGYGADDATKDMARILSSIGITDIKDFGKIDKYEPVQQIGMTFNGQPAQSTGSGFYVMEAVDTGEGTDYVRRDLSPEEAKQVQPTYGVQTGIDEYNQPTYAPVSASNVQVKDGQLVGVTGQTFGNKLTGQAVPVTYSERQKGDFFGGTFEGKGNTGYGVQFDAQGQPIFYTQGASSADPIVKAAIPIASLALAAMGAPSMLGNALLGAGANQVAAGALGGALIGGGTAALTDQDVGKGALLGGATGGLFGGSESLLGSKVANMFSSGVTPGVQLGADAAGTALTPGMGINNLFSSVPTTGVGTNLGAIGSTPIPATTTTGAFADGINLTSANLAGGMNNIPLGAMDTSKIFNYTPPTAMDKITGAGTMLSDWAQANPSQALSSGLQGYQALNQPAPPLNLR